MNVVHRLPAEDLEIVIDPTFGVRNTLLQRDAILPAELGSGEAGIEKVSRIFARAVGDDFGEVLEFDARLVAHERDQIADRNGSLSRQMKDVAGFTVQRSPQRTLGHIVDMDERAHGMTATVEL